MGADWRGRAGVNDPTQTLREMFAAFVAAADPARCLPPHLPAPPAGRTIVLGAGKASAAMARVVERHWSGPLEGLIVTRYGHAVPCERIEIVEAAHPVPDQAGHAAAGRIVALAESAGPDDLVLCLISGGGSALLTLPAEGVSLADKQEVNQALLRSGATIGEMNCIRKHLSAVKGGRLAVAAAPARVLTLAISDVPGDDLSVIASGPTVPDSSTLAEAQSILKRYGIAVPASVTEHLDKVSSETPKPGDKRLEGAEALLVATPMRSLRAAAEVARQNGLAPMILGDAIEGEAREVAKMHAGVAKSVALHGHPLQAPAALLSGGETTVTMHGHGRGGRNAEFLLSLGISLDAAPNVWALAADSDGIDGSEDNAGAMLGPDTLARAEQAGLSAADLLHDNNAYVFFEGLGDLVKTGPTLTNVNDFRAILVGAG